MIPAADVWWMPPGEDGFTLIELLVVVVLIGILSAAAFGFSKASRERADDATARSNIRIALPAIEAYRQETGSYTGLTLATLQSQYSRGIAGIVVVSAHATSYCVSATVDGATWYRAGPNGPLTKTACV